jgi:hypothetical protein
VPFIFFKYLNAHSFFESEPYEPIRVLGNMGFLVVYSVAAEKIQVEIRLALRFALVWATDFPNYRVPADALQRFCLSANSHKTIRGNHRMVCFYTATED